MKGVKLGARTGNWLTRDQASLLLEKTEGADLRSLRDVAMISVLLGCGLRRAELPSLEIEDMQIRQEHWAIVDLVGKSSHVRTVPMPNRVKRGGGSLDDRGQSHRWSDLSCHDPYTLQEHLIAVWPRVPAYTPSDLSVALTHLDLAPSPDLFGIDPFNEPNAKQRVVTALDTINARYGLNTVYLGSIHQVRKEAQTRIPFGPPPPLEEFDDTADKLRTRGVHAASEHEKSA